MSKSHHTQSIRKTFVHKLLFGHIQIEKMKEQVYNSIFES